MNLTGLCVVLVALLVRASSKSITEAPVNPVEGGLEEQITTPKIIADNATAEIESPKSLGDFGDIFENFVGTGNELQGPEEGRTFGLKRLQFMMMPMIYKMGVMMTLLVVLTVISLKGLAIGVMLLVLKLAAIFGKLFASAHSHGGPPAYGWAPPPPQQPVHVHVHNSGGGHDHHPQPYGGWEPSGPPQDEHYYYKG